MRRACIVVLGICVFSSSLKSQELKHRLTVSPQEVKEAASSRAPYLRQMEERSRRGIFPDDDLERSLAEDHAIALVEVVNMYARDPLDIITLKAEEVLRGDIPEVFPTVDYGGPTKAKAKPSILPDWGWMRVQAKEHGKYLVALRPVRPPEKPSVPGEYYTDGVLDLRTDEAQWVTAIRRLLALEARSVREGPQVLIEGLRDDSKLVRRCSLWKLSKLCKLDSPCWNATVDAEAGLLGKGDEERREEAINSFETLMVRSFGITLTFEAGSGKRRMVKEMNELGSLDFSIDKDVSAPFFRMGVVTIRSKGPERVYPSQSGQRVRTLLEGDLDDPDLAIGDEAYSLLTLLRSGAPEHGGKCSFVVPPLRKNFEYSGEVPQDWLSSVVPLIDWCVCNP